MCYPGSEAGVPLTLGKLEARPAKRTVKRKSTDNRDKVLAACRSLIQEQIDQYRKQFWQRYEARVRAAVSMQMQPPAFPKCPLTGKRLKSCKTHVDHYEVPFVRLVEQWLTEYNLNFESLGSTVRQSRSLKRYTLGSTELDDSWAEYHRQNAVLELVEAKANMSKGCKPTTKLRLDDR